MSTGRRVGVSRGVVSEAYAQRRALNEPLTEIVQNKGQSDTIPELSSSDEFANYEIFDRLLTHPEEKSKPHGSYIREAYGRGLVIQSKVGANPYKYGVVGATDIHNGLSTTDENGVGTNSWLTILSTIWPSSSVFARAAIHSWSLWNEAHFFSRSASDSQARK